MKKTIIIIVCFFTFQLHAQYVLPGWGARITGLEYIDSSFVLRYVGNQNGGICSDSRDDVLWSTTHGVLMKKDNFYNTDISLLHFDYPIYLDTLFHLDSSLSTPLCDTTSGFCHYPGFTVPLDHVMDKDSNYYVVYLTGDPATENLSVMTPMRMYYMKIQGEISPLAYGPDTFNMRRPGTVLDFRILEEFPFTWTDIYLPDKKIDARIFLDKNEQPFVLYHSDLDTGKNNLKLLRIDSNSISTQIINDTMEGNCFHWHLLDSKKILDSVFIFTSVHLDANCDDVPETLHYHTYKFDEQGAVSTLAISNQTAFNDYIRKLQNDSISYVYRNLRHDSSVVKYYNRAGDTIRTIYFPVQFTHAPVRTSQNRYIAITIGTPPIYGSSETIYLFDSTGRLLKTSRRDKGTPGGIAETFAAVDRFDNILFGYMDDYPDLGSSHCSGTIAQLDLFNIKNLTQVTGKIIDDRNHNCMRDAGDTIRQDILIEMQLNGHTYYTMSGGWTGDYSFIPWDTGHARIILHLNNQTLYTTTCNDTVDVYLNDTLPNPQVNFLIQKENCPFPAPKINVNISTPVLLRCGESQYTLSLNNNSETVAINTYADVTLDRYMVPADSQFNSATFLGNNTYRFYCGDIWPRETKFRYLKVKLECDSVVAGQMHCVNAVASPYVYCSIYDGPYITASAYCEHDSVIIQIGNSGHPGPINNGYRIIVNDSVKYTGIFHLDFDKPYDRLAFANPTGATFRFETSQYPVFPQEDSLVSVTLEGCGNDTFSTVYALAFPQNDYPPYISEFCTANRSSFDPNEKTALPAGVGDSSYILPNAPIEYTIQFQNTGTYYANSVQITDTISSLLDMGTFKLIGSSHEIAYYTITDSVLYFYIYANSLIWKDSDNVRSTGFIRFSIYPKKNIPDASSISNSAYIVMDYNTPVKTNTVVRTVHNFLGIRVVINVKNIPVQISTSVYPNPFDNYAMLSFEYDKPTRLNIISMEGKVLQEYSALGKNYFIYRRYLSSGMYLYELRDQETNVLLSNGKLIVN